MKELRWLIFSWGGAILGLMVGKLIYQGNLKEGYGFPLPILIPTILGAVVGFLFWYKNRNWCTDKKIPEEKLEVIRCAYCGHPYPPSTPTFNHPKLDEHIKVCEKHPMRKVLIERDLYKEALKDYADVSNWNEENVFLRIGFGWEIAEEALKKGKYNE